MAAPTLKSYDTPTRTKSKRMRDACNEDNTGVTQQYIQYAPRAKMNASANHTLRTLLQALENELDHAVSGDSTLCWRSSR